MSDRVSTEWIAAARARRAERVWYAQNKREMFDTEGRALDALDAVLALHGDDKTGSGQCFTCEWTTYPCPTVRAITGAEE